VALWKEVLECVLSEDADGRQSLCSARAGFGEILQR